MNNILMKCETRKYINVFTISFFLFIILLFSSIDVSGQSESHLRNYFKDNILALDPIEGIYDVEFTAIPRNAIRIYDADVIKDAYKIYIFKEGNKFIHYDPESGRRGEITRIGDTNVYTYTRMEYGFKVSNRLYLQENSYIEFQYNHPTRDKGYVQHFLKKGNYIVYKETMIKSYPTTSMYTESIKAYEDKMRNEVSRWSGTGFALYNGYIVTNYHVVENAGTISIVSYNNQKEIKYNAKIIGSDKINDIALLKVYDTSFIGYNQCPYTIKKGTSNVGEGVFVLGFPLTSTMGNEIKLTTGVISSKTGYMGDVALYQISAPVQPGNSGGPLFDDNGNLVGVICAKHNEAENAGYAIKTSYLENLIETISDISIIPNQNTISKLSLSDKVEKIKDFVFLIECSH